MKNQIKISFIIPFYNGYKYLEEAIDSIKALDINKEIIIVNDGEIDIKIKSTKVIKNSKNMGSGFSRNVGIKNISKDSTHIFFIDSDDIISSSDFIDEIIKKPEDIIDFNYREWYRNKKIINKGFAIKNKYKNQIWGMSIPTKLLDDDFLWRENQNNDSSIKHRIMKKLPIIESEIIAVDYRIRKSSVIHSKFSENRATQEVMGIISQIKDHTFDISEYNSAYFELYIHKSSFSKKKYIELMDLIPRGDIRFQTKFNAFFYRLINFWKLKNIIKSIIFNRKMFK